jgi:hypothetical protein
MTDVFREDDDMPSRSGSNPWGTFYSSLTDKAFLDGTLTLTAPGTVAYTLTDTTSSASVSNGSVSTANNTISFDLTYTPGTNPNHGAAGTYQFSGAWNQHAGGPNANSGYSGTCSLDSDVGDGDDWFAPTN